MKTVAFIFLFFCFHISIQAQNPSKYYALNIHQKSFTVAEQSYEGSETSFIQPYKEVKKEWWKYIKSKAVIFNHVTHYELKIPTKGNHDLEPIYLISTLHEEKNGSSILRVAYKNSGSDRKVLDDLLKEFKVSYFTRKLECQIKSQEKMSKRLGKELEKYHSSRKTAELDSSLVTKQQNSLEYKIHRSDLKLDSMKSLLKKVK